MDAFDSCDSAQLEGKCSLYVEKSQTVFLDMTNCKYDMLALNFTLVFGS